MVPTRTCTGPLYVVLKHVLTSRSLRILDTVGVLVQGFFQGKPVLSLCVYIS